MMQPAILDIATALDALTCIFQRHDVKLAYLFGSQVEGVTHAHSDVDIAVLFAYDLEAKERFHRQLRLTSELMSFFSRNDVDVVVLNDATALLAHEVVKYGKVLYEDESTQPAVEFKAQTIVRYADTQHFRELASDYFRERRECQRKRLASESCQRVT